MLPCAAPTLHVYDCVLQIRLVLLDEVHLLNEPGRGSSLEAGCVCRIKALAAFPEMAKAPLGSVRFVAVSATIPNIGDVSALLPAVCSTHSVRTVSVHAEAASVHGRGAWGVQTGHCIGHARCSSHKIGYTDDVDGC